MKNLRHLFIGLAVGLCCIQVAPAFGQSNLSSQTQNFSMQGARIGIVNAKKCLDESKLGKYEQSNYEKMNDQMEAVLKDKEKALQDVENKINDDDYMDSISEEATSELRRKRKSIREEGYQLQNQYIQTLQQTKMKIIQKLTEVISKASKEVAKESTSTGQPISIVLNDEATTYYDDSLDISDKVITKMNLIFDTEQKDIKPKQN